MKRSLRVAEIFHSIQGESTRAGLPCVFVRLTGCDLRCSYCDSKEAYSGGTPMDPDEILAKVKRFPAEWVEITGGEPLLQSGVHELTRALLDMGKRVMLETSGAHDISSIDPRVVRIVDLKCPSSGEASRIRWENLSHLKGTDEVKFVVGDRSDFDWALQIVRRHRLTETCPVLVSAVWGKLPLPTLAEWIVDSGENLRLQPQLHKILWGDTPSR